MDDEYGSIADEVTAQLRSVGRGTAKEVAAALGRSVAVVSSTLAGGKGRRYVVVERRRGEHGPPAQVWGLAGGTPGDRALIAEARGCAANRVYADRAGDDDAYFTAYDRLAELAPVLADRLEHSLATHEGRVEARAYADCRE